MNIFVMSDIHAGPSARPEEWRTGNGASARGNYLDQFLELCSREKFEAHYIFVPGDLTDTGQHGQFVTASNLIEVVASKMKVRKNNVLAVPGNHDVNRDVKRIGTPSDREFWHGKQFDALCDKAQFMGRFFLKGGRPLCDEPFLRFFEDHQIEVVLYNSAAFEQEDDNALRHGYVTDELIKQIDLKFRGLAPRNNIVRIFMTHHHPIMYSDVDFKWHDISIMTNSDDLLVCLERNGFDLFIHGHKHIPRFRVQSSTSGAPIVLLSAGSFSVQLENAFNARVSNVFHLIEVHGRDPDHGTICGYVNTWAYADGLGWFPGNDHTGLEHKQPFGPLQSRQRLVSLVEPLIQQAIAQGHGRWSAFCKSHPALRYVTVSARRNAIRELQERHQFDMVEQSNASEVIFIPSP